MNNIFDKAGLRDLRDNGSGSMIEDMGEGLQTEAKLQAEEDAFAEAFDEMQRRRLNEGWVLVSAPVPYELFREACERITDMIESDDGEAFFEGEKFLKRNAPDIYNVIGASLRDDLPDFPEQTLFERLQGWGLALIVGIMIRKPRQ